MGLFSKELTRNVERYTGPRLRHMTKQVWVRSIWTLGLPYPAPEKSEKFVREHGAITNHDRNTIDSGLSHDEYVDMLETEYGFPREISENIITNVSGYVWEAGYCPKCEARREETACEMFHTDLHRRYEEVMAPCCTDCGQWVAERRDVEVYDDYDPTDPESWPDEFSTEYHTQNLPCGHSQPVDEYEYFHQALVPGNPELEDQLERLRKVRDETECPDCFNTTSLTHYVEGPDGEEIAVCEKCHRPLEEAFHSRGNRNTADPEPDPSLDDLFRENAQWHYIPESMPI